MTLLTSPSRLPWLLLLGVLGVLGCRAQATTSGSQVESAQFGLFFGGQVQQRVELAFELDPSRQTQGFQLKFRVPAEHPTPIEWTLDYPTARSGPRGPSNAPRAQRTERTTLPSGAARFDQLLALRPTDLPGTYNIQVRVDGQIVMDRPFLLVTKKLNEDD